MDFLARINKTRRAAPAVVDRGNAKGVRTQTAHVIEDALQRFSTGDVRMALGLFASANVNPGKVIALYPQEISGWLWAGDAWCDKVNVMMGSRRGNVRNGGDGSNGISSSPKDAQDTQDAPSTSEKRQDMPRDAIDELIRYLTEQRQKYSIAMEALGTKQPHIELSKGANGTLHTLPRREEVLGIGDIPFDEMNAQELAWVARAVDTALFKSYMEVKPIMVSPLCRVDNWCIVSQVQDALIERNRIDDVLNLYRGKNMHREALEMLRHEADVPRIVNYLWMLGPHEEALLFEYGRYAVEADRHEGWTFLKGDADQVLSVKKGIELLEPLGHDVLEAYIEYLIHERGEKSTKLHEMLIHVYMQSAETSDVSMGKLVHMLETSEHYRRHVVMGQHKFTSEQKQLRVEAASCIREGFFGRALEIFVHKLKDYASAEEYAVLASEHGDAGMVQTAFTLLMRAGAVDAAEGILKRHGTHLDVAAAFEAIPQDAALSDVREMLLELVRSRERRAHEAMLKRSLYGGALFEATVEGVRLAEQSVHVGQNTECAVCGGLIGSSVFVYEQGRVTHVQCSVDGK